MSEGELKETVPYVDIDKVGGDKKDVLIVHNPVRPVNLEEQAVTSNPTHLAEEPDKKGRIQFTS